MDHGGHGGHVGHGDMPATCNMNMLFNWQIENTCIVFEWWHIRTAYGFWGSCLVVFAIAAGYEFLRVKSNNIDQLWYEARAKRGEQGLLANDGPLLRGQSPRLTTQQEIIRSSLYAVLVGISFWLMLVFMTYNGYLMLSVVLGAGVGHFAFGQGQLTADRSIQCH
ncbi:hypothetical protein LRAMOSA06121 [Lichtheimia ramosa]|uniref:Copper transport protein n=1 Tax=Lichtheimia ramosa TaxID=688394 RepID=A0A077X3T7_9FUNG|nr:hypothetical protein LRAMOSA06121 [Lichtheimia ramosa]